jgi:p-cumate 2,3-dioxygenase beta subunit
MSLTSTDLHTEAAAIAAFLFDEAALLDAWQLEPWLELFTEDARYVVPSTDIDPAEAVTVDPASTLCLIHDNLTVLRSRVRRLLDKRAHAANPRARTRHHLSNVRVTAFNGDEIETHANFLVTAARSDGLDLFAGEYVYHLVRHAGTFRIRERRAVLDLESLSPMGQISFIL